jgi:hypothetical protein
VLCGILLWKSSTQNPPDHQSPLPSNFIIEQVFIRFQQHSFLLPGFSADNILPANPHG